MVAESFPEAREGKAQSTSLFQVSAHVVFAGGLLNKPSKNKKQKPKQPKIQGIE